MTGGKKSSNKGGSSTTPRSSTGSQDDATKRGISGAGTKEKLKPAYTGAGGPFAPPPAPGSSQAGPSSAGDQSAVNPPPAAHVRDTGYQPNAPMVPSPQTAASSQTAVALQDMDTQGVPLQHTASSQMRYALSTVTATDPPGPTIVDKVKAEVNNLCTKCGRKLLRGGEVCVGACLQGADDIHRAATGQERDD